MEGHNYYQSRINKSLDFMDAHLGDDLKISDMAEAAHFSTFHYQRIYRALQNESPYETLLRLRLEKSVFLLKHDPKKGIQEIAQECGFGAIENFSRQFKKRFGFTASIFRKNKSLRDSRIYQEDRSNSNQISRQKWDAKDAPTFEVQIDELPQTEIVVRKALFGMDGSGLVEAYEELMQWYESAGKLRGESKRYGMSVDDPDVTPSNLYRYDFAVARDQDLEIREPLTRSKIPGGPYAKVHCEGDLTLVGQVWDFLYKVWLPESGYVPRHFPAIEEFLQGPEEIGWDRFNINCLIPLETD